jgi:hypothetical protein
MYSVSLDDIITLSDAICHLDCAKHFYMHDGDKVSQYVERCHDILERALGEDAPIVYWPNADGKA